jgi:hypothetical protein
VSDFGIYQDRAMANAPRLIRTAGTASAAGTALVGALDSIVAAGAADANLIADPLAVWVIPFDGADGAGSGEGWDGPAYLVSYMCHRRIRAGLIP